jgi:hypothetical protein
MSRSESFAIGAAMITVALTVLTGSQKLAWLLLVAGSLLVASPYFHDWRYGEDRPSRRQIDAMSSEDYKKRCLDPKFRRWVNRVFPKQTEKRFNPDDF